MEDRQHQGDEVLAKLREESKAGHRGRLKIFLGYAAGVGKTYSMLEAARAQAAAGASVVLGYVEPHARPETEALTLGMEMLHPRSIEYRGIALKEFDLDAALARHPALMIVDEYAHTNAPGCRHAKRWQDIEELLSAGVNVYATLNVQHIETLNDIVAQVSGIQVHETVPDAIFDRADSIELVDLPPEELLQRFLEGKVYVPAQAQTAMEQFFKLPNLIALRELSLRRAADRINAQAQTARAQGTQVWATSERLLVCVGPSPTSIRVIRIAKRMASALRAPWVAVNVDTGAVVSDAARQKLTRNLNLAEQLGAESVTLSGQDVAEEIVKYAHARRVTKIIIGKTGEPRWREILGRSVVGQLLHRSGDIDVYVIRGKDEPAAQREPLPPAAGGLHLNYVPLLWAVAVCAACTGIDTLMRWWWPNLSEVNQVMVLFLGVALVAVKFGRWPGVVASLLSVLAFDFFSVKPYLNFAVNDAQYFITFAVMLAISVLISHMAHRIRRQAEFSRQRERRTEALYSLSRQLAGTGGTHQLVATAESQLGQAFASEVAIFLPDSHGRLKATVGSPASFSANEREIAVAQWVFEHRQLAGTGTDTLPEASAFYLPLISPHNVVGVLAVRPIELDRFKSPDQRQLLETLAGQIALAIDRDQLAEEAQKVLIQMEIERMRNSLLSSVSHDLRTPLAVISGASTSMLEAGSSLDEKARRELLETIADESSRMAALVDNLLNLTRLEAGGVVASNQWYPVEEIVGTAIARAKKQLGDRRVQAHLPADLPLVKLDAILFEQALINLLENAGKYTPPGSLVDILARMDGQNLVVEIADRGPGLTEDERDRVFDKFYRGSSAASGQRGAGLGLAICRAVVAAHGGRIWEENRPEGGARFIMSIPQTETPPAIEPEAESISQL